ncbi:MAG: hypothetical protein GX567_15120 [Clostridia bacterium]|nr:hypothetical protein [Clostridia bacterium]
MEISEIEIGLPITLEIKKDEQKIQFNSAVEGIDEPRRLIFLTVVEKDGKLINFGSMPINLVIHRDDDVPILFRNCHIELVKAADNKYMYCTVLKGLGVPYNRRNAFRCFVGLDVVVQVDSHKSTFDAILRDVSSTGFGLVFRKKDLENQEFGIGTQCHTHLVDAIDKFQKININLHGVICRIAEVDEEKVVYGCELMIRAYEIDKYIRAKERENLRNRS